MKARFVDQGADRYVVGNVTQFDQKNEMFCRPLWDEEMLDLGKKFYMTEVPPRNKPGYRLKDQAMVNAAWHLENTFAQGVAGGRMGKYAWEWDQIFEFPLVPPGLKIDLDNPAEVTDGIKRVAKFFGSALVGVCKLDRRWVYSAAFPFRDQKPTPSELGDQYQYAIAIAIEMNYQAIRCSPTSPSSAATGLGYSKMAFIAGLLAHYIRGLGFKAIACGNDTACSIPIAIDAGLGELARNGLLITPAFGPRIRLAKVLTDMPLIADRPIEFGVWDFCLQCEKCAVKCPSQSIAYGEPTDKLNNISNRQGLLRWPINAVECLRFWAANGTDCANCIRTCPFNKPTGWLHDTVRWGVRNLRWLNPFFLWMDDICGYGKQTNADKFWTMQ
ncbi:MAG TPA: reductive dehalogenase [Desulfobacterales bacterium]|nr:reductive dehalogenase [Desulfobacterales bacterium]